MTQDYISYIRSKVGHDKIILNFAGGILADENGRILLQKRSDFGSYGLPGGAMELGESSKEACEREFFEETGIKVEATRLLNVYTKDENHYPNGDEVQTVVILYEVKALEAFDITDFHNEETLEVGFYSEAEIAELEPVFDKHRRMIAEYFADTFALGN
ncbi:NUDIX hydrolase [Streptococcus merionis]|uniref:NUDIX hydrolase n=1 Tax=Streptococcus merionis TaxID=400065 RepID=UPI0026F1D4D4|nr:NUDIX domain-containing protein [Streptococcus merionis]